MLHDNALYKFNIDIDIDCLHPPSSSINNCKNGDVFDESSAKLHEVIKVVHLCWFDTIFQCFDAVGWVTGRASSL